MKTILAALAASALLVSATAPASAQSVSSIIAEAENATGAELVRSVKARKAVPRQMEYDTSKLPLGSSEWWQQYDRERGGRGRR